MPPRRICLLGLENLPAMSRDYASTGVVGGEPVQQSLLAKALARRGFEVTMVVLDGGQPDGTVVDRVRLVNAYRLDAGVRVLRFFHPRWTGVMRALSRAAADAYYTSCAGLQTAQVALAARRRGAVSVFRIASDSDCDPGKLLVPVHGRAIYSYGLRRVDVVLAQTQSQQQALRYNYGLDSRLAGMLVERGRSDLPYGERGTSALWVSNIRDVKRPDLVLELARSAPELQFELVGGTQPRAEQLYAQVEQAARAIPNLAFRGPVAYHDVGPLFERARVLVNTSDVEGFPNTYLQAWARGVPVVAFFDPDGVIARERLGVAVRTVEEMRAALRRLAGDENEWRAASERCLRYMAREYSDDRILRPYLDAFAAGSGTAAGA
jgi:glycosyltransferase involved in cell wall biosynthesis